MGLTSGTGVPSANVQCVSLVNSGEEVSQRRVPPQAIIAMPFTNLAKTQQYLFGSISIVLLRKFR